MSSNTNLGNTPVNQGFVQLIHTGETGGIDGTLRTLFDGDGTASDLQIASDKVKISTELFIGSKTLTEFVQDTVGAMFSSNTETNITATYQDDDGTIDLVSSGEVTLTGSQTLSNKTLTSPIIDSVTISTIQTGSESFADNDTSLMTSAAINDKIGTEVASLVDSAPGTLDTLNELAAALGDDPNFATTTATNIATKLAKASNLSDLASASTARSNLGVDAAGTDNSTNVTLANTNYLSISGQEITGGTIPVASGGTGATSASGARTALGVGAIGQLATISVSNFNDAALQTSSESFADNDTSIMTSAAIQDKIQSFGFTTNTGDMTGVSITASDPLDISQSNTTSGNYSATISLDASEFGSYLTDMTDLVVGDTDELAVLDNGTLKRKQIDEIRLTAFDATGFSSGISFDGSTANGVLTFKDSDEATVESNLTFDGTDLKLLGDDLEMRWGAGQDFKIYVNSDEAYLVNVREDKDIRFMVNDGNGTNGANITALKIDASEIGRVKLPNDAQRLVLGASDDLHLEHSGTDSFFSNNTGDLYIRNNANDKDIILQSDDGSGGATAYLTLDGSVGYMTAQKELRFADGVSVQVGNSGDATFFHTSGNTTLQNGTGNFTIQNLTDDGDLIFKCDDGSGGVENYMQIDGSAGRTLFNKHIRVNDGVEIQVGSANDMPIYHNGTNSLIDNYTGSLIIQTRADDEDIILKSDDGSGGVTAYITLDGSATRVDVSQDLRIPVDNKQFKIGAGEDLLLYHDGSNTHIQSNTAPLIINQVANSTMEFKTNNTSAMTINASQNVGIGTTSPASKLHIQEATAGTPASTFQSALKGGLILEDDNSPTANNILIKSHSLGNDEAIGGIKFVSSPDGGNYSWAGIQGLVSTFAAAGQLAFYTAASNTAGATSTERMRIDSSGNVGIGTTSPDEVLHIFGSSPKIKIENSAESSGGILFVDQQDESQNAKIFFDASARSLDFHTDGAEAMTITGTSDGRQVGIGTTSPSAKLHIAEGFAYIYQTNGPGKLELRDSRASYDAEISQRSDGRISLATRAGTYGSNGSIEILDSGNVGIGTTSPSAKLHVDGSAIFDTDTGNQPFYITRLGSTDQALKMYVDDNSAVIESVQDETSGTYGNLVFIADSGSTGAVMDFKHGTATKMRLEAHSGNLGIGTTSPADKLHVSDTTAGNPLVSIRVQNSNGYSEFGTQSTYARILSQGTLLYAGSSTPQLWYINGSTAMTLDTDGLKLEDALGVGVAASTTDGRGDFSNDVVAFSTSDKRLKENIKPLDNSLDKVLKISGVEFDWKELTEEEKKTIHGNQGHDVGVIAQEVEEVLPEVVTTRDTGYKAVKYEKIVPLLIEAIKEQQQQIEELKNG